MDQAKIVIRDIHRYGDDLTVPEAITRLCVGGPVTVTVTDPAPPGGDPRGDPRHGFDITISPADGTSQPGQPPEITWGGTASPDRAGAALFAEALAQASQLAGCTGPGGKTALSRAAAIGAAHGRDAARRALAPATPAACRDITARLDAADPMGYDLFATPALSGQHGICYDTLDLVGDLGLNPACDRVLTAAENDGSTLAMLLNDGDRVRLITCCPALKITILAASEMLMKNRAFRAVWWWWCRAWWVRCRAGGRFVAGIAACGQAGARNGGCDLAGRGRGQQPAAGAGVDHRPRMDVLQLDVAGHEHRRSPQVLQRPGQFTGQDRDGERVLVKRHDGADGLDAQLSGRAAGSADPAPHGAVRDGQLAGDGPVPGPGGGTEEGLADQGDGVAAARQQPGLEQDVGEAAAAAQCPVRAHRDQRPGQVPDRPLAGVPPRPHHLAAGRAGQLAAGQQHPGRFGVEDLDHRPCRQDRLAVSSGEGSAGVAAWHQIAARATWAVPLLRSGTWPTRLPFAVRLIAGHDGPDTFIGAVPPPTRRPHRRPPSAR